MDAHTSPCEHQQPNRRLDVTKPAFTVSQFSEAYAVGKTTTYEEIAAGRLITYKVGRRRYISAHAAAVWQERLEFEANFHEDGDKVLT